MKAELYSVIILSYYLDARDIQGKKFMRRTFWYFTFMLVVSFILTGCGKPVPKDDDVLASVGDTKITVADFNKKLANLPERYRDVVKKRKAEFLQEVINDTLLYQEARNKGLHKDQEVRDLIVEAKKKILITRLLKDEVEDAIEVTDEDMEEFYDENKDRYMTPEIMRVSHILVLSRDDAQNIQTELDAGARFEDLARAKSIDPTAQRAGDIGYFPKGQLMPEFENACAKLDVGEVSGIVKTKLGYHIIKLTDRRQPEQRPIKQVSDDIKARVYMLKRQETFKELLERLRGGVVIEIDEEILSAQEVPEPAARVEEAGKKQGTKDTGRK